MTLRASIENELAADATDQHLSWRAWLLLPLALVALAGIVVPFTTERRERTPFRPVERGETRHPYRGELLRLLDHPDLSELARRNVRGLHATCLEEAEREGGKISEDLWQRVQRYLKQYGR